jgi:two-component system response regulator PrrA
MATVLVVEDDPAIRSGMVRALGERGHAVSTAGSGMSALQGVVDDPPDIVLLDLGLPDVDGRQVLAMIRSVSQVPVVVVSARDQDSEVVSALDAGADDYVIKPVGADQLDARVRAVLRRTAAVAGDRELRVGGLTIDPRARAARLDERSLELTRKEFDLLLVLAERAGTVVSKRELLAEVWRQPYGGADRTVDVHLSWLRRKLGESADAPRYLHSVWGVGVRLEAPASEPAAEPGSDEA